MSKENEYFDITSELFSKNENIGASSDQQITHDIHAHERPISEICGINYQDITALNKQDEIFLNYLMDIKATQDEIGLANINFQHTHNNSEIPNLVESCCNNQESKHLMIIGENTSNKNTSQTDTDSNVADIQEFDGIQMFSKTDTATLPGPSWVSDYNCHSYVNLCTETEKILSPSKLQRVGDMKTSSNCLTCKKKMSEHFEVGEEKNLYKCCLCDYSTEYYESFVIHISNHSLNASYCNECKVFYLDQSLHSIQRKCDVCSEYFACKFQLEDHYMSHENHHKKYCRLCRNEIVKHALTETKEVYKCCKSPCQYESKNVCHFRNHLHKHSDLKLFKCNQCGRRYTLYQSLCKHLETPESCFKNELFK